jgi:hypothetical protein
VRPNIHPGAAVLDSVGAKKLLFRQNAAMIEFFDRSGVPYLDTYPALKERDAIEPVYFDDDPHTNALGHEVIAGAVFDEICAFLEKSGLSGVEKGK